MAAANPTVGAFVGIPKGPDGRLHRDRLETALKYGFMIVRWHLAERMKQVNNENSRIGRLAVRSWEPTSLSLIIIDFIPPAHCDDIGDNAGPGPTCIATRLITSLIHL